MELYEFRFSTYNEKVRWALDFAEVPYTSCPQLPGLHASTMRKLSGQTATPVLVDGDPIVGSAAIIAHLAQHSPALMPTRTDFEPWQAHLDDVVGPALRHALFCDMLDDSAFARGVFTAGRRDVSATLYRWGWPMLRLAFGRMMDLSPAAADASRSVVAEALDDLLGQMNGDSFGDAEGFCVEDLIVAAMFFPIAMPPELPLDLPAMGTPTRRWLDRWASHGMTDWVRSVYAAHRQLVYSQVDRA